MFGKSPVGITLKVLRMMAGVGAGPVGRGGETCGLDIDVVEER